MFASHSALEAAECNACQILRDGLGIWLILLSVMVVWG